MSVRQFVEGLMDLPPYFSDPTRLSTHLVMRQYFNHELLDSTDHRRAIPAYIDVSIFQIFIDYIRNW